MPTLPTDHGDTDVWGAGLNAVVQVEHNADGTHKATISSIVVLVGTAAAKPSASNSKRLYYETDTGIVRLDTGSWVKVAVRTYPNLDSIPTSFPSDWSTLTGKPTTFAPSAHQASHQSAAADPISGNLDAIARTKIRLEGSDVGNRRAVNLHAGANVTLTVTDDNTNEEVDVTINATAGGGGSDELAFFRGALG